MTNYKLYTIKSISKHSSFIRFSLSDYVDYSGGSKDNDVDCLNAYPFNTYEVGDHVEVDNDRTPFFSSHSQDLGSDIVRKVSSSEVAGRYPSSSTNIITTSGSSNQTRERGEQMRRWVEESGGEYETAFIAQEEQRTDGSVIRQVGWVYRKK